MNRFQRWYMRRIIRKQIVRGHWHFAKTEAMMTMIVEAWRAEFNEDNLPTTQAILHECLASAIEKQANETTLLH